MSLSTAFKRKKSGRTDEVLGGGAVAGQAERERHASGEGPALVDPRLKLKPKEALQILIQMRAMLDAGVPMLAAIRTLIEHAATPISERVLQKISSTVESGHDLSYAIDCLPNCYEKFVVHLVSAGEQSGALEDALQRAIDLMDSSIKLNGKIKAALAYPGFLMFMTVTMTVGILMFLVPKFESLLMKRPDQLPWTTKLVLGASNVLRDSPAVVGVFALAVVVGLIVVVKSKKARSVMFEGVSHLPVVGDLIFKAYLSRSVGTLAMTLESGVPILTGLEHARQVGELPRLQECWDDAAIVVREGQPMFTALEKQDLPPALIQMIVAGESSGSLDTSLRRAAEFLDRETQAALETFTGLLGPACVVFAGGVVGFIVISLMTPILTMAKYVG